MHDEHEHDHLSRDQIRAPKVSLRSMSKSDPHLNIPHLLMSQDETHPSLNRIVSGLFHVNNALHTPITSCDNLQDLHHGTLLSSSKHHLLPNET
uniref:Ovule protein n=1 Tax=Heterorhabditis bacteriophora TaxID=37862 RepID=A0A1I7WZY4_HETBA